VKEKRTNAVHANKQMKKAPKKRRDDVSDNKNQTKQTYNILLKEKSKEKVRTGC
jgi:hypothetical protein